MAELKLNLRLDEVKEIKLDKDYRVNSVYAIHRDNESPMYKVEKLDVYTDETKQELKWTDFAVMKDRAMEYLPDIYFYSNWLSKDEAPQFKVQTTSYGSLDLEELSHFITMVERGKAATQLLTEQFLNKED